MCSCLCTIVQKFLGSDVVVSCTMSLLLQLTQSTLEERAKHDWLRFVCYLLVWWGWCWLATVIQQEQGSTQVSVFWCWKCGRKKEKGADKLLLIVEETAQLTVKETGNAVVHTWNGRMQIGVMLRWKVARCSHCTVSFSLTTRMMMVIASTGRARSGPSYSLPLGIDLLFMGRQLATTINERPLKWVRASCGKIWKAKSWRKMWSNATNGDDLVLWCLLPLDDHFSGSSLSGGADSYAMTARVWLH